MQDIRERMRKVMHEAIEEWDRNGETQRYWALVTEWGVLRDNVENRKENPSC